QLSRPGTPIESEGARSPGLDLRPWPGPADRGSGQSADAASAQKSGPAGLVRALHGTAQPVGPTRPGDCPQGPGTQQNGPANSRQQLQPLPSDLSHSRPDRSLRGRVPATQGRIGLATRFQRVATRRPPYNVLRPRTVGTVSP